MAIKIEHECFLRSNDSFSSFREIVSPTEIGNFLKVGENSFRIAFHFLLQENAAQE